MKFKVGAKVFELTRVNLKIRNIYAHMADLSADLTLLAQEADAVPDQMLIEGEYENLSDLDAAKAKGRIRDKYKKLDDRRRELADNLVKTREELLQAILEKNGYEYDPDFWAEEADIEDINDITTKLFRKAAEKGK